MILFRLGRHRVKVSEFVYEVLVHTDVRTSVDRSIVRQVLLASLKVYPSLLLVAPFLVGLILGLKQSRNIIDGQSSAKVVFI